MLKRSLFLAALALPLLASAASAQSWDTPEFWGPKPMDELGVFYVHSGDTFCKTNFDCYHPNGLKAVWRQTGNINLGVQGGFGDLKDLGQTIMLGAEAGKALTSLSANGLIAQWSLGAGAMFGSHYVDLAVPLGVSIGLNLGSGNTSFVPYVHPRVSLDLASVDNTVGNGSTTNTDIGWAVDIGAEIGLGQSLLARAAYTAGSNNRTIGKRGGTVGAGLALRIPRKVYVRGR